MEHERVIREERGNRLAEPGGAGLPARRAHRRRRPRPGVRARLAGRLRRPAACWPASGWPAVRPRRSGCAPSATGSATAWSRSRPSRPHCAGSAPRWRAAPAGCPRTCTRSVPRSRAPAGWPRTSLPFVAEPDRRRARGVPLAYGDRDGPRRHGADDARPAGPPAGLLRRDRRDAAALAADLPGRRARPPRHRTGRPGADRGQSLLFKDSPFSGWVQEHVEEPTRNALCVASADELDGPGFRVTESGQTRNGRRGAHGRSDQRNIIGFSNEEAIAEIDAQALPGSSGGWRVWTPGSPTWTGSRACSPSSARPTTPSRWCASTTSTSRAATGASRSLQARRTDILSSDDQTPGAAGADRRLRHRSRRGPRGALPAGAAAQGASTPPTASLVDSEDLVKDRLEAMEDTTVEPERGAGRRADGRLRRRCRARRPRGPAPLHRELPPPRRAAAHRGRRRRHRDQAGRRRAWRWCSGTTSSSGTRRTSAPPPTPTPTTPASSTTSAARAWPTAGPSGAAGSPSGAGRTWCRWSARWPPPSRRSRTGWSRSTRSCAAWSSEPPVTGCGSACAGCSPRTCRCSSRTCARSPPARAESLAEEDLEKRFTDLSRFMRQAPQARAGCRRHDHDDRPRPPARRTTPRGDQRRALRLPHRRGRGDLSHAGGEVRW
ncbi:hypothetical protein G5V59_01235 [Nocardioides sp. W3-2-3]|uniref:hypothetical protein n=1 Tax=Nocardioides convexus TaxID=2712224 RepID=UPI0024188637|nr:hypothetical protein [Nocardioides convexus]NGZ99509.1 hypothetical protein [Nocardioides convexus]